MERTFEEPIFPSAPQTVADIPIKRFTGKHVRVLGDWKLKLPNDGHVTFVGYVFAWAVEETPPVAHAAKDPP